MFSNNSRDERPTASTFGRLTGARHLLETPPRSASLRQRRGVQNSQPLEFGSLDLQTDKFEDDNASEVVESVQESTLRKRERIAELRRRRQEGSGVRAGLGAGFFDAPDNAIAHESPPQSPPMKPPLGCQLRGLESPESESFFERGDLALLLQPVEVPDIDALLEPPKRPAQTTPMPRRVSLARPGPLLSARCGAAEFTINIPSTSLSPVLPQGWGRNGGVLARHQKHQQRRLHGAALQGDESDGSDYDDGFRHQQVETHVDGAVAAQLEAELARNKELHAELARLLLRGRRLANLVLANENIRRED
ncbi:hypothetical protein H4S07_005483 [Coemansia furcata]|uniref:Uncharacterized protein n=1 Tax=Coemansia furcata TaxID=417177 RepID=A0ACC1L2F9_9FUNG|nr:hypothetical protein H4S07_005483 [Coemansia furcata]